MAKRYEELTLADDFMFCKVLSTNPRLCRELTELITGRKVGEIQEIDKQRPVEVTADGRGIRFDIYMEDENNTLYNIEMQAGSVSNRNCSVKLNSYASGVAHTRIPSTPEACFSTLSYAPRGKREVLTE